MSKKRGRPRSKNPSESALYHRKWRKSYATKSQPNHCDDIWEKIIIGFGKLMESPFKKGKK